MKKILLVEDDPLIYRMYEKLFRLERFEIETAGNGKEGLDKLQSFQPDIILLDVMMKDMNGIEMLTQLKADPATAGIPVVVLTNVADMRVTQMAIAKGAVQVIIKSDKEPDEVVALVNGVLDAAKPSSEESKTEAA